METENRDPLDDLFVDGEEVNRVLLRDILINSVRIDEQGRIFPLRTFFALSNKSKVLLFLLARKAVSLKTNSEEELPPAEIGRMLDMPKGSLNPTLRALAEERLVDDSNGRYKVLNQALLRCSEILNGKKAGSSAIAPPQTDDAVSKLSMSSVLKQLVEEGRLDEGKTAKEIHELVVQRRPGTKYSPLYKIILDSLNKQLLVRELRGGNWAYRRAAPK